MSNKLGIPFIVSAPSGAGKTTLCNMAVELFPDLRHSISYTTRSPRQGETDGVEYHFISEAAFERMAVNGEFLEFAGVHGKRYGTSKSDLTALLESGVSVLLDIDVQGAMSVKEKLDGGVYVFIMPPSIDECERRLKTRAKDSELEIERRMKRGVEEISLARAYDYIIINDDLGSAFEALKAIITAERHRARRIVWRVDEMLGKGALR